MTFIIAGIPASLSEKLIEEYLEIKRHYVMRDWKPSQLEGGRLAEVVLRIFQHLLGTTVTPFGTDIPSPEKDKILNTTKDKVSIDLHVRQKIVPQVRLLLDFRNNRDVAHLGGFSANGMDSQFVVASATWIVCELIRVFGGYSMDKAQKIVDEMSAKDFPAIFEFESEIYIARTDLKAKEQVLILLNKVGKADEKFLFEKTSDNNITRFRLMLKLMLTKKLVGLKGGMYFLMPAGIEAIASGKLLAYSKK